MSKAISRRLVLTVSLVALPGPANPDPRPVEVPAPQSDPRTVRIQTYFQHYECPAADLAADFVLAADRHKLDWRLLPAISMIESAGGKGFMNNNIFGWDNCRVKFSSVRAGVYIVAEQLATSGRYRAKTVPDLLRTYNPVPGYGERVRSVMRELGPAEVSTPKFQSAGR